MEIAVDKIWMSEKEACDYTSFCRRSLQEFREAGKLTYRTYGRKIIYNRGDLDKFIERNTDLIKSVEDRMKDVKHKTRK